jgi:CRP-like cAMP-binding protein
MRRPSRPRFQDDRWVRLLMAVADLLRNAWVLADLSDEQRDGLAAQGREVTLSAGNWLLRQGEEAETMYVIRSGWLEAIHEGPPETVIRTMRRGEMVASC